MITTLWRYCFYWLISLFFAGSCFASEIGNAWKDFPLWDGSVGDGADSVDLGKVIKDDAIDPDDSASELIQKELGVNYQNADNQRATFYIKQVINRFLAVIWLIALIVLIYWFYKMFFASDGEESFGEALKIVKWAALALFVIWLSWFIVSMIFDIFYAAKEDIWN
jgi:Type IV secretion system pilin